MRAEERDPAYLWDMLEAAQTIMGFMKGLALEQFTADGKEALIVRLAVERKLEILGEAARRISVSFKQTHPEIPWSSIIGLRNVISHEYTRVDYDLIYRLIQRQLPALVDMLAPLIPPLPPEDS
ncbi:MAG TPA: DUF86 domain-containing protein [Anaerolineaceae bacterium]|jgi:uncharacterized protein with HEPN domain|nr:DUF86 domain-containing protein [Anaerolineaceae bacterium]HPK27013.1 DUF86 domain-containing protein [Anaerolineaceae bacterium]